MNNSHIRKTAFILVLAGLCLAGRCHAVTASSTPRFQAENDSGLSGKQIVKMRLDKFISAYYGSRWHKSDETACIIYQNYKKADNLERIVHLAPLQSKRVKLLYAVLLSWKETESELLLDDSGGGAIWREDYIESPAYLEECVGKVIDFYQQHHHHENRRLARSPEAMRGAARLIDYYKRELLGGRVERASDFRHRFPVFRRQTALLAKTMRTQPPAVQCDVAKYLMLCPERFNPL